MLFYNNQVFNTNFMKIDQNILPKIRENRSCVRDLEDIFDRSNYTILKWLRENNPQLCRQDSLHVISKHLKIDIPQIIDVSCLVY